MLKWHRSSSWHLESVVSCSFDFWWTLSWINEMWIQFTLLGIGKSTAGLSPRWGWWESEGGELQVPPGVAFVWSTAIAMGVTEGVTQKQHLQHHPQLHASEHRLVCIVCSILSKGISNLQFLGFQRVPCVALGSASFISFFLSFSSLLHLEKPKLFSFFFLFNCVKSTWSEKAKKKLSDDK